MRNVLLVIVPLLCLKSSGQNANEGFDGKKWEAPYVLDTLKGWDVERFLIPISFAPFIPYKGVEDIRFTPGWAKKTTNEYWSYAFLWYLDGTPTLDAKTIENNLKAYYTGLIKVNTDSTKIADKIFPVTSSIRSRSTEKGDLKTFEGSVTMLDYMSQKPITLNFVIHIRTCAGKDKTFVFHEISPMPYSDEVWKRLHQLWMNFKCNKE
ncbi:MAG TPA: hypothetical protein VFU29_04240 [Chitinophagaceae bacterium]|nr:hypothetical protein [Chitinophagaceae bacterium]